MGGKSSRTKGFGYERGVVNEFREAGLEADRMWGSDGRSGGHVAEVDIVAEEKTFQCKRTKAISAKYKPAEGVYGQIFREDRGESYVLLRLQDYIDLLRRCKHLQTLDQDRSPST